MGCSSGGVSRIAGSIAGRFIGELTDSGREFTRIGVPVPRTAPSGLPSSKIGVEPWMGDSGLKVLGEAGVEVEGDLGVPPPH